MAKLLVYGSKEFGQVIRDLIPQSGNEFAGFADDVNTGPGVIGDFSESLARCPPDKFEMVIAIGYRNLQARWAAYQKAKAAGYSFPKLIHPRAYVRNWEAVGDGSIVMAGALVDMNASLEELVVLWPGAVVNHHSSIGRNVFLSPNSTVCGFVEIGADSFVGAGAVITDHVAVPAGSFMLAYPLDAHTH